MDKRLSYESLGQDLIRFIKAHFGNKFLRTVRKEKYGFRLLMSRFRRLIETDNEALEYLAENHVWILYAVDAHTSEIYIRVGRKVLRRRTGWRGWFPCLLSQWARYDKKWQKVRARMSLILTQETLKRELPFDGERFLPATLKIVGAFNKSI